MSYHARQLLQLMFKKNPRERGSIPQIRLQPWLHDFDLGLLPSEEENTSLDVEVTAEEVKQSLTEIMSMEALVRDSEFTSASHSI